MIPPESRFSLALALLELDMDVRISRLMNGTAKPADEGMDRVYVTAVAEVDDLPHAVRLRRPVGLDDLGATALCGQEVTIVIQSDTPIAWVPAEGACPKCARRVRVVRH